MSFVKKIINYILVALLPTILVLMVNYNKEKITLTYNFIEPIQEYNINLDILDSFISKIEIKNENEVPLSNISIDLPIGILEILYSDKTSNIDVQNSFIFVKELVAKNEIEFIIRTQDKYSLLDNHIKHSYGNLRDLRKDNYIFHKLFVFLFCLISFVFICFHKLKKQKNTIQDQTKELIEKMSFFNQEIDTLKLGDEKEVHFQNGERNINEMVKIQFIGIDTSNNIKLSDGETITTISLKIAGIGTKYLSSNVINKHSNLLFIVDNFIHSNDESYIILFNINELDAFTLITISTTHLNLNTSELTIKTRFWNVFPNI